MMNTGLEQIQYAIITVTMIYSTWCDLYSVQFESLFLKCKVSALWLIAELDKGSKKAFCLVSGDSTWMTMTCKVRVMWLNYYWSATFYSSLASMGKQWDTCIITFKILFKLLSFVKWRWKQCKCHSLGLFVGYFLFYCVVVISMCHVSLCFLP